jgi:endonuclease/exonuclease/phosphatase family metal-dependent hydrolase
MKYTVTLVFNFLALGFISNLYAQVPAFGVDSLLDVGCWNIEWFGDPDKGPSNEQVQFNNVKQVLNNTDIDIWGLTEMSNPTSYQQLLNDLPQYGGCLATYDQTQKTSVFYKKDMFEVIQSHHILSSSQYNYDFAGRPPFEVVLKTKSFDNPDTIYVIVVHLKAFADQESYNRRKEAINSLKSVFLDVQRKDKKTIVLGDWNDDVDVSTYNGIQTPFQQLLDDPQNYFFPTKALSDAGENSYASYSGSFIDHILITSPLKLDYKPASAKVLDMMPTYISSYTSKTSDHYPVIASFHLDNINTLDVNSIAEETLSFAVSMDNQSLLVKGNWMGNVEIIGVDGSKLNTIEKQNEQLQIPINELPQGMYIATMRLQSGIKTFKFIR